MEENNIEVKDVVIGINDHPFISFHFDTHNFHSPDTVWFLDSVNFDGCKPESSPKEFYEKIIEFCRVQLSRI